MSKSFFIFGKLSAIISVNKLLLLSRSPSGTPVMYRLFFLMMSHKSNRLLTFLFFKFFVPLTG